MDVNGVDSWGEGEWLFSDDAGGTAEESREGFAGHHKNW
jgi:hypothetical protein